MHCWKLLDRPTRVATVVVSSVRELDRFAADGGGCLLSSPRRYLFSRVLRSIPRSLHHCREPITTEALKGASDSLLPLSFALPTAAMQRVRPFVVGRWTHGRGQFPVIQAPRRLRHQRPVSRYCRHSRSPARGGACTCTATQSRPTPFSVEGRSNVCWSKDSTGAPDP